MTGSFVAIGNHFLPLVTTQLFEGAIENLKFKSNIEVFYSLWVEDCLRTLKIHHGLPLVTNCCLATTQSVDVIRNLKFEAYFHCFTPNGWSIVSELQGFILCCHWLPIAPPSNWIIIESEV